MKIVFLLGSPDISGGTYVVFEHATRIKGRGHEVYIVTEVPLVLNLLDWHPAAKELNWVTFKQVQNLHFDIAIATWWRTVYELYRVNAKAYVYFVQSIESRFFSKEDLPLRKLVDSTYTLPLKFITEVHWIRDYLEENYGVHSNVILNGIRKDIYQEKGEVISERIPGQLRILIEGPLRVAFKNVERTIGLCKESKADEVWLLTSSIITKKLNVNRAFSKVPIYKTPSIYRSCDVLVKLSYVEGMFGPPLEMFHCGGTAIVYNVTGFDEYIKHGENALVAEMGDEAKVIQYINELKTNPELLARLKKGARLTANSWPSWERSSLEFEQALINITMNNENLISQKEIERQSKFLFNWYELAEMYRAKLEGRKIKLIDRILPKGSKRRDKLKEIWIKIFYTNRTLGN